MAHTITCTTAYRARPSARIDRTDEVSLTDAAPVRVTYADLVFEAQHLDDPQYGSAVNLRVTSRGSAKRILEVLYQLEQGGRLVNQFAGGHGFTGLHYVYEPATGSELQFWCALTES